MKLRITGVCMALAGALLLPAAHAGAITFTATGGFQDGSTLSGFVTIDTATGLIGIANLAISGRPVHFTTIDLQGTWPPSGPFLTEFQFSNGQATDNLLTFLFPPVSLIGYGGGLLCDSGNDPSCFDGTLHYRSNFATRLPDNSIPGNSFVVLTSGSLTPSPEPSTVALCLVGLAMGVLRVRGGRAARSPELSLRSAARVGGTQCGPAVQVPGLGTRLDVC